jgi:hypothetical protein
MTLTDKCNDIENMLDSLSFDDLTPEEIGVLHAVLTQADERKSAPPVLVLVSSTDDDT